MTSNAGNGKNHSRLSTRKHKDDECAKSGCSYSSDQAKDAEDLGKKFEEIHRLRKYLDFFEAMLTEMKKLNGDIQGSERDSLSIADHLKGLLCDMDKVSRSGLRDTDSSDLYRELTEKFSQLDNMVNRVESVFSGKTVRNLTKLLDDCEKNMIGFKVGLKEFQYVGAMERKILELLTINEELCQLNKSKVKQVEDYVKLLEKNNRDMERHNKFMEQYNRDMNRHNNFMEQYNRGVEDHKKTMEKYNRLCKRLQSTEDLVIELTKKRGLEKRRNSW